MIYYDKKHWIVVLCDLLGYITQINTLLHYKLNDVEYNPLFQDYLHGAG